MADEVKISGLPPVVTPLSTDYFPVVQAGVTKRETIAQAMVGGGAVLGPSSATDNALVLYDGATGKLIQNSNITLDYPNMVFPDSQAEGLVFSDAGGQDYLRFDSAAGSSLFLSDVLFTEPAQFSDPILFFDNSSLDVTGDFDLVAILTANANATFPAGTYTLATTSQLPTPSALTANNDTNVTLTLGGSPNTALLQSVSITAGWSGVLSSTRGGTGVNNGSATITIGGSITYSGAFTFNGTLSGNTAVTFPTSGTLATTSQIPTGAALTKTDDTNVTLTLGGSPTTALVNAASIAAGWTGTLSGTRGGTGVNNGSSTFTIGGNTSFVGAFTFAGTITGNTAVTFPTSGTLATTTNLASYLPLAGGSMSGAITFPTVSSRSFVLGVDGVSGDLKLTTNSNPGTLDSFTIQDTTGKVTMPLLQISGATADFQVLMSTAATSGSSFFSTAVYPATTTINQLLYSSSANTITGLSTANNAALITSSSGVPSLTALGNLKFLASNASGVVAGRSLSLVETVFVIGGGASQTFTPATGSLYSWVRMVAGGGGGGGVAATIAGQNSAATGGGGGEYAEGLFTTATIIGAGTTAQVNLGAAGTGGTAGNNNGVAGGTTNIIANGGAGSTLMTALGGNAGTGGAATTTSYVSPGNTGGGGGTGGSYRSGGGSSGAAVASVTGGIVYSGFGGFSVMGRGGRSIVTGAGVAGSGAGGGGSGASNTPSQSAAAGGDGVAGQVVIIELVVN